MFRYVNLRIFLFTLAFGLAFVPLTQWAEDYLDQVYLYLPKASEDVLVVDVDPEQMGLVLVGHGCGGRNKYGGEASVTDYSWNGHSVSTSRAGYDSRALARRDLRLRVQEAAEVLEDSRSTSPAIMPVRLVLRFEGEDGESFEIVTYDGDDLVKEIASRDLATALWFEAWENEQDER